MKCAICGKEISSSQFSYKPLCSSECFTVDFWNETLDSKAIIIKGECYHDGGNRSEVMPWMHLGHAGRVFNIRMIDGERKGLEFSTNNLWYNGKVPEDRNVKDNAEFFVPTNKQKQEKTNEL